MAPGSVAGGEEREEEERERERKMEKEDGGIERKLGGGDIDGVTIILRIMDTHIIVNVFIFNFTSAFNTRYALHSSLSSLSSLSSPNHHNLRLEIV